MDRKVFKAVSLFTGAGIGDVGFREAGYSFCLMTEKEPQRLSLAEINFPEAEMCLGDINELVDEVVTNVLSILKRENTELHLLSCTAPCQGMSKSGQGTLLSNIRQGKRPKLDPRNRLILPALLIIHRLSPRFVVFENVCEMRNTVIEDENGRMRSILDIIDKWLGNKYVGEAYDIQFADYGIPQRRKRLITVNTSDEVAIGHYQKGVELIPKKTHSKSSTNGLNAWTSVSEALKEFPPLDAKSTETASNPNIPFHRVPKLDRVKYEWIKHTPPGASAFDNQCINTECRYENNSLHGTRRNHKGINQSNKDTPLYCERCGALLPRPHTVCKDGSLRIMCGYTSAYKRMEPTLPCPALTRNLSYPCSDHKVHPFENRVLSLAEAFVIHTLSDYAYKWGPIRNQKGRFKQVAFDTLIRLVLGESIPPKFTELLGRHLIKLTKKDSKFIGNVRSSLLFQRM